ncbi:MAG: DEAD/DEAH box helicase [Alphaproteobacteria bacterium]|nr:DEAD/DEAH box helicase [Alphaproteobacteria bacterium]
MIHSPQQMLVDLLAVAEGGLTQTAILKLLGSAGVRIAGRKPNRDDILELVATTPGLVHDGRYALADPEPHFRRLWSEGRVFEIYAALGEVEPFFTRYGYIESGAHVIQRALRRALLAGDDETVRVILKSARGNVFLDLRRWFLDPLDASMLERLTDMGVRLVVGQLVEQSVHWREPLGELHDWAASREHRSPGRRTVAGRLHLLGGRLDLARAVLADLPEDEALECRAMLALLDGDARAATRLYAAHLAAARKLYGNDYVPHAPEAVYLPVAYVLDGTKSRIKQAQAVIERAWKGGFIGPDRLATGWTHVAGLVDPTAATIPSSHPVSVVLEALVACWRGESLDSLRANRAIEELRALGLVVFADAIEAGADGPVARLRSVRPAWKDSLAALERALGAAPSKTEEVQGPDERLAWTLTLYRGVEPHLEARVQKARKDGWSAGRKVADTRLHGVEDPTLPWTPADRTLASAIRKRTYRGWSGYPEVEYAWDPYATWRALVGHPCVFDANGTPLRVVKRTPVLRVVEEAGGLRVALEPAVDVGSVRVERVGNAFEVILLESDQRAAAEVIGSGLTFPADARAAVRELVARAGSLFRSEAPEAAVQEGSPVVHVFLVPVGTAISVDLGVLPAGPEGPRLAPGVGAGVLLGPESMGSVRIARDLGLEKVHLAQAAALPGLEDMEPGEAVLLEIEAALDLIATAREREIPVLWPEGGEIRVRRPSGTFGIQVRTAREWFEASGAIELDDGERLALADLARRFLSARERFVELDDGSYLALESKLRRSLDALVRLGEPVGDAIRVHPLATSALASVLDLHGSSATAPARARIEAVLAEPEPAEVPRGLKAELRPYQREAFQWLSGLAGLGAGAILADDMGLGKTITALALLLSRRRDGPALVVAPTSVGGNWVEESRRFAPGLSVQRLREIGAADLDALGPADVVVCSYGLLVHRVDLLATRTWSTVVFDESQALKNPKTQRHQAALRIQAGFRLALTGTPIENHLGELHAQMSVVLPGLLGPARRFAERFARPVEAGDGEARRSLKALVSPFLLRRTKDAVLDDLPSRTEVAHHVELSPEEARLYEAQRLEALESLDEGSGAMDVLGRLSRLRQLACSPRLVFPDFEGESSKTKAFRRLVRDLHDAGHRALVFSQFVKHLQLLREVLDDEGLGYAYLDGSTPAARRDALVAEFQSGDVPFFLISLKAGGTGLNLTAADYVLHMDPWWNPAVEDQASDRAHRIGQQRPVTVYRVVARGTVEEQIVALHARKRDLADQILEGSEQVSRLSADDLVALLREAGP